MGKNHTPHTKTDESSLTTCECVRSMFGRSHRQQILCGTYPRIVNLLTDLVFSRCSVRILPARNLLKYLIHLTLFKLGAVRGAHR